MPTDHKAELPPIHDVGQLDTEEVLMKSNDLQIVKSEGAKQIEKLCCDIAVKSGLELEPVYWSFEFVKPLESKKYILNVKAKNGMTTEILFSRAEIEACTTSPGREITEKNIKMKLEGFL
jgi:hypothetical protein